MAAAYRQRHEKQRWLSWKLFFLWLTWLQTMHERSWLQMLQKVRFTRAWSWTLHSSLKCSTSMCGQFLGGKWAHTGTDNVQGRVSFVWSQTLRANSSYLILYAMHGICSFITELHKVSDFMDQSWINWTQSEDHVTAFLPYLRNPNFCSISLFLKEWTLKISDTWLKQKWISNLQYTYSVVEGRSN